MARIGRDHSTGPLAAVERDRVRGQLLAPEGRLEILPQPFGHAIELRRHRLIAQGARQLRGVVLGGVDITLHLAQRDRPFGKRAVGMKDRIARILPALIGETGGALPVVFDKPVMIEIAIGVDPLQRRRDVRP